MSMGERLRRARIDAGKTLDQVAAETKIQLWILEALEREDFSRVPGGVFIRGYLTAFARVVGLAPSEILAEYTSETAPPPAPPSQPAPPDLNDRPNTPLWQYVVIVAIVLVGAVMWRNMARSNPDVVVTRTSAPPVSVPAPAPPPAPAAAAPASPTETGATATSGATAPALVKPSDADAAETRPAATAPLVVQLHANDESWIEATADEERKVYRLVMPGEDLRLDARNQIRLLVGDAGAVSYTINGEPAPPLGGPGVVREIVITPDNYQSLITPHAAIAAQ
jgi:cytoskeleton protein RodZ